MALSKCPMEGWIFVTHKAKIAIPLKLQTESQKSEPKLVLKYLITPNFCAKFQPNQLTTIFGPWQACGILQILPTDWLHERAIFFLQPFLLTQGGIVVAT